MSSSIIVNLGYPCSVCERKTEDRFMAFAYGPTSSGVDIRHVKDRRRNIHICKACLKDLLKRMEDCESNVSKMS